MTGVALVTSGQATGAASTAISIASLTNPSGNLIIAFSGNHSNTLSGVSYGATPLTALPLSVGLGYIPNDLLWYGYISGNAAVNFTYNSVQSCLVFASIYSNVDTTTPLGTLPTTGDAYTGGGAASFSGPSASGVSANGLFFSFLANYTGTAVSGTPSSTSGTTTAVQTSAGSGQGIYNSPGGASNTLSGSFASNAVRYTAGSIYIRAQADASSSSPAGLLIPPSGLSFLGRR